MTKLELLKKKLEQSQRALTKMRVGTEHYKKEQELKAHPEKRLGWVPKEALKPKEKLEKVPKKLSMKELEEKKKSLLSLLEKQQLRDEAERMRSFRSQAAKLLRKKESPKVSILEESIKGLPEAKQIVMNKLFIAPVKELGERLSEIHLLPIIKKVIRKDPTGEEVLRWGRLIDKLIKTNLTPETFSKEVKKVFEEIFSK